MTTDINRLKAHRFDPPGNWRWPCRFSLEELKELYLKLFGFTRIELNLNRPFKPLKTYHVYKDKLYGMVKLEDGGCKRLESCTVEELDWFLFIGKSFSIDEFSLTECQRVENPLFCMLDRESALIKLDLLQI